MSLLQTYEDKRTARLAALNWMAEQAGGRVFNLEEAQRFDFVLLQLRLIESAIDSLRAETERNTSKIHDVWLRKPPIHKPPSRPVSGKPSTCVWCGEQYVQRTTTQKYCNERCRDSSYRNGKATPANQKPLVFTVTRMKLDIEDVVPLAEVIDQPENDGVSHLLSDELDRKARGILQHAPWMIRRKSRRYEGFC